MMAFLGQDIIYLISFSLLFLIFLFLYLGIMQYLSSRKNKTKLIRKIQQGGFDQDDTFEPGKSSENPLSTEKPDSLVISFFSMFGSGMVKSSGTIKLKFLRAGIQWKNIDLAFTGAKIFFTLFFVGIFLVLRVFVFKVMEDQWVILCLVSLGLFGFYLPEIWLKQKTDNRKIRLFKGLPDALDLLVVCVEAGMGLDSAINRVGKEMETTHPDMSREFSLMNLETRAGKQRQDALRNLAKRTGIDEMVSLVTLLIQTDKFGTSVATALKVFSDSFRTKRFQRAEEAAAKLPVTILLPLMIFIFPALFVVILGPAAITIYQNIILK